MPDLLPTFAELHAISDIHLGGERSAQSNFQIFAQGKRLAGLIDHVAAQRPGEDVALVLNGDIIDSLAEEAVPGYVALDEATALRMMERICNDESFGVVFEALAAFLAKPRRHLIVVLGNHDIELALPVVQADLRRRLAGGNLDAPSRLVFSTHGAGFACRVGRARVFCTHGNEVDLMNWVDYNLLGQLANAMTAGRPVEPAKWKPNGGTRLVVDVMNLIKQNYPFVDLLKPETAAIAGVLLALDRDTFRKVDLGDAFPILKDALRGRSITSDLLGQQAGLSQRAVADVVVQELLGPNLRQAVEGAGGPMASEEEMLLQAGAAAARGQRASSQTGPEGSTPETLGAGDYIAGWLGLTSKPEALRRALQDWLADDKTYDLTATTHDGGLFEEMQARVGEGVDFTITGHTHLARALRFPRGGYYYNCGTWIRLLRLSSEVLASRGSFETDLWPAFNARSMDALDQATLPGPGGTRVPLLLDRTNAVRISAQGQRTVGDLLRVTGDKRDKVKVSIEEDGMNKPIPSFVVG